MALETKDRVTPEGQATDDTFNSIWDHPDNDDVRDNLSAIEQNPTAGKDAAVENLYNYMKDPSNVSMANKPSGNKFKAWLGRNKWSVAGGGSAIILLGGLFSIAAPLKLQGILESLTGVGMGRIESYVEKRTQKIVFQALFKKMGVADRSLVKGGSLIERIAKTMATNKFEERLAAKGLTFEKKDGKMVVKLANDASDAAKKLLQGFDNSDDLVKALDGIPVTKRIMKAIVKEDLGVWGFLVRGKITRWMMSYLGIKRFGTAKTDQSASAENKKKAVALDDIADSVDAQGRAIEQASDVMQTAESIGSQSDEVVSGAGKSAANQSVKDALAETANTARKTISEATSSTITKIVLELGTKLGLNIGEAVATKIGTKAIPIYGWAVAGATAVVFAHWAYKNLENGNAARAVATPAAILMGNIYAKWGGIATQSKLGTLDTDLYNYYTPFLDGVEKSSLFNCMDKNWTSDCESTGEAAYKKLNETNPDAITKIMDFIASDTLLNLGTQWYFAWDFSPNYLLARLLYKLDDAIMGFVMDRIIDQVKGYADLLNFFATVGLGEDKVNEMKDNVEAMISGMAQFAMEMMLNVFGLNVSMLSGGYQLFDILLNGSIFTANKYGETSFDMYRIDEATASGQLQRYLAEENDYNKSKGVLYALFSPDASNSVTSNIISRTSFGGGTVGTASNMIASLFGMVKSTPSSLADIVTNKASAGVGYTSPEAVVGAAIFGLKDSDLNAPLSENLSTGEACPGNDIGDSVASWFGINTTEYEDFNNCQMDTAIADSVLCSWDSSIRETPTCNPDAGGVATGNTPVSGTCPATTTVDYGMQDGYNNSTVPTKIHTCGIKDWPSNFANSAGEKLVEVNAGIAEDTVKMAAALKADSAANGNYSYTASLGFRTFAQQQCIYDYFRTGNKGCSDYVTQPRAAASPGYSNHQMGYSIDIEGGYSCSSPSFTKNSEANRWLDANMKTYGFSRDVGCSDYGHITHAH